MSVAGVTPDALLAQALAFREQGDWAQALAALTRANIQRPSADVQQQLIDWRIEAGRSLPAPPESAPRVTAPLGAAGSVGIPEIAPSELSAARVREAVYSSGALIVRGLLKPPTVETLRQQIERVVGARENPDLFPPVESQAAWYVRSPEAWGAPSQFFRRPGQTVESSSIWVADSPRMACELLALYESLGLPALLASYFGEPARLSVKKWVLRKMAPKKNGNAGWHQDGRFLGEDIRSLNLWLALSDCGGDAPAPGMDLLVDGPREIHPTGTDGAWFDWTVGPERVARLAREASIVQPRFAPGDALLFDQYSLHRTALEDHHSAVRYAIEAWFFAASTAPARQQPLFI